MCIRDRLWEALFYWLEFRYNLVQVDNREEPVAEHFAKPLACLLYTSTDSIKRSMQSAGMNYQIEGRGGGAVYAFTEPQSVLKLLLISDYGFTPNRNLDKACELFKGYFLGRRPYTRMFKKDIAEMLDVCADTVSRWIQNFYDSGLLAKGVYDDTLPTLYCTSFKVEETRHVAEITEFE